jgi:hypothetical protein
MPPSPQLQATAQSLANRAAAAPPVVFGSSSSGGNAPQAAPSKQQLVSKVFATGLTDFDDDSDTGDELLQQQQRHQLSHSMHHNSIASQQGGASRGVQGAGQAHAQLQAPAGPSGGAVVARAGFAGQGMAVQQADASDEFDF